MRGAVPVAMANAPPTWTEYVTPQPLGVNGRMLNGCNLLRGAEFYIAIDNKGLWPNLTLLPNGETLVAVYNHPSHGLGCGNVELWASADGGRSWTFSIT